MHRHARITLFLLLSTFFLLLPQAGWCTSLEDAHLGGFNKSLGLYLQAPPRSEIQDGWALTNRTRLDLTGSLPERLRLEFSLENLLLYTDPAGLVPLPGTSANRAVDLEREWNRDGGLADQLLIDRLNLKTTRAGIDWTLGRQAVGFGRITLFSPLDIVAPFPPDALDTEVRPGVDALRAGRYFGLTGQATAVGVFGGRRERNSYLATVEYSRGGVDLLALGGSLRERSTAGFGLASQLAGMGIKGEIALYLGRDAGEPGGDLHEDFAMGGIELDYRFENDLVLFLQYLHNGAGVDDPEDYPRVAASAAFREGLTFLLGRHYLLASPSYRLHPLATLGVLTILNLEDDSWLARPLLDLSLSDNWVLQLFWSFNRGDKPRRFLTTALPRSEFGSAGDAGGVFLKYFF